MSGLLLTSIDSEHTSHVCLHNLQPSYSKHSCSSYFSQASLLTTFAHIARVGKQSAERKCYLFSARGVLLR